MPSRKGSNSFNTHHKFLGEFRKNKKTISVNEDKILTQLTKIAEQNKKIHGLEMSLRRKKDRLDFLNIQCENGKWHIYFFDHYPNKNKKEKSIH